MKPATFDHLVSRSSSGSTSALDLYLDRAGRHRRLSEEQERRALETLAELRRQRWSALLSNPATRDQVLERVFDAFARPEAGTDLVAWLEVRDKDGQLADRLSAQLPHDGLDAEQLAAWKRRVRRAGRRYFRARNRFVCANLRLVLMVTDRYSRRWMPLSDLVQEGNVGLIKAVERFDSEHGCRFSTYAVWWIRHALTTALVKRGRAVRVPAHLHALFMKARRAKISLEGRLGRPATTAELAEHLEVPPAKLERAVQAMELRAVSLDGPTNDDGSGMGWSARLGIRAPQGAVDDALDQQRRQAIALEALERLPDRERDIVERRFAIGHDSPMTLEALGRSYDVSRERIRQLQNRALGFLRKEVESSSVSCLALA